MFIFLIPIFYILLWIIFFDRQPNDGLREIFLKTTLLFFGFVAITTEILSLFHWINTVSLILVWAIADAALFIFARQKIKTTVGEMWKDLRGKLVEVPKFYLTLLIFIYSIILTLALVSPPNTYDSMTYHLARVANWIQFGSVEFYPTAIVRQLYQPPLAEYSLLHFQILSSGDYFSNLIQWFALILCGVVVSLITREFGQNLKTQTLAVFLAATLPAAIVQGSSTQNDLVISLFILAFFYFWIRAVKSNAWTDFIFVGLALALALLTKGTAYIYCFPIGAFFVVVHFLTLEKRARWRFIKQVAFVLVMAIALNAGQYARNYNLFGAPVTSGNDEVRNKNLTAKMVFSNLVRNYAINLGTKSAGLKNLLEGVMTSTFGDELKNPDSTWLENEFRITYSTHEDSTGNFIHIILITLVLPIILLIRADEKKYIYGAVFSILSGFVLLALLLKWQIYGSRLQMPLFLLGCALAAIVIARLPRRITSSVALIIFIFSWSSLFFAQPREIFSGDLKFVLTEQNRKQKFFKNLPDAEALYTEAAGFIKQQPNAPETVGLMLDFNDYEYPFWYLLKDDFSKVPSIYHVGITNASLKLVGTRPLPEFIISIREGNTIEGIEYKEVWKKDVVRVLQKNAP
jgi:Dolichyl-phosphate-mannose-protein mannosyltransferase